jgi:hypothetical protein
MSYGFFFFLSLLLTLAVEIPVLFLSAKYLLRIKILTKEILYWGVFVNLFSLPYLWFVFSLFISSQNYILIGEILVGLIESVILMKALKINLKNAIILSVIANVASYLIGLIVFR